MLEEERGPSARALHGPVGNLGNLEPGAHRVGDPDELARAVDRLDEVPEVVYSHSAMVRKA